MKIKLVNSNSQNKILAVKAPRGLYLPARTKGVYAISGCDTGTVYVGDDGDVRCGAYSLEEAANRFPDGIIYEGDKIELEF